MTIDNMPLVMSRIWYSMWGNSWMSLKLHTARLPLHPLWLRCDWGWSKMRKATKVETVLWLLPNGKRRNRFNQSRRRDRGDEKSRADMSDWTNRRSETETMQLQKRGRDTWLIFQKMTCRRYETTPIVGQKSHMGELLEAENLYYSKICPVMVSLWYILSAWNERGPWQRKSE